MSEMEVLLVEIQKSKVTQALHELINLSLSLQDYKVQAQQLKDSTADNKQPSKLQYVSYGFTLQVCYKVDNQIG